MSNSRDRLLLIEDDALLGAQLRRFLKGRFQIDLATNREEAMKYLQDGRVLVVLLDLGLPPYPESPDIGLKLLAEILFRDPLIKVIIITAHDDKDTAQRALSLGAYDFLAKPLEEGLLLTLIERAIYRHSVEENWLTTKEDDLPIPMVIASEEMRKVVEETQRVASLSVTVLIAGESGTGKELIAQLIHKWSPRREGPLVVVDCAAIPVNLGEAELFGAERGAYTGAVTRMEGKINQADGGTLFLDEIGELSWEVQAKLLRFLETKEYAPLGGKTEKGDVRIIAATNRELEREVHRGKFRLDLFYRLTQLTIHIPSLRERRDDILSLAHHFVRKLAHEFGMLPPLLSAEAEEALLRHPFPGNVRELKNMISKALLLSEKGVIAPGHLGLSDEKWTFDAQNLSPTPGYALNKVKKEIEKRWIREALRRNRGKIAPAARDLGIPRTTLYELVKRFGIKAP
ncbi:MAG: sigma-54-dependent Fis family transcriptional regulator [Deltaproteobacteria bacterium]|nr:sigma-54-dependent Fis family transcriptional regulator [Deltaproteobacteria bacterium]